MPSLRDKTVAITRSEQDAQEFFQIVRAEGGRAVAIPAIEIVPAGPDVVQKFITLLEKKKHDYCAFMSAQAARVLFDLAGKRDITNALKQTTVIAVGPKTGQELEKRGIKVDMMPSRFSSIGLAELLSEKQPRGKKIIIPRSGEANEFAAKAMSELGMDVDEVFLYNTRTAKVTLACKEFGDLLSQKQINAVVFTSASNVRAFFEIMRKMKKNMPREVAAISIGPFTTAELVRNGMVCHEAEDHTINGTVQVAKKLLTHQE